MLDQEQHWGHNIIVFTDISSPTAHCNINHPDPGVNCLTYFISFILIDIFQIHLIIIMPVYTFLHSL